MPSAPRVDGASPARSVWRVIRHAPADGAWNMAVDEALLERYAETSAALSPTLRLYAWRPATLSLGKSQNASAAHDPTYLRRQGIDLVRRPTGGGAVLHEHERTYSVVGRLGQRPFRRGVRENYGMVAAALVAGLRRLGLDPQAEENPSVQDANDHGVRPVCFGSLSSHEISIAGLKLVGSAQLRRRGAFLQHGSILLRSDSVRLGRAVGVRARPTGFTDLERAMGRPVDPFRLDRLLVEAFEACFSARLRPADLTADELDRAVRLSRHKYRSAEWTLRARVPSLPTRPLTGAAFDPHDAGGPAILTRPAARVERL